METLRKAYRRERVRGGLGDRQLAPVKSAIDTIPETTLIDKKVLLTNALWITNPENLQAIAEELGITKATVTEYVDHLIDSSRPNQAFLEKKWQEFEAIMKAGKNEFIIDLINAGWKNADIQMLVGIDAEKVQKIRRSIPSNP